jgi:hypothetical protein
LDTYPNCGIILTINLAKPSKAWEKKISRPKINGFGQGLSWPSQKFMGPAHRAFFVVFLCPWPFFKDLALDWLFFTNPNQLGLDFPSGQEIYSAGR